MSEEAADPSVFLTRDEDQSRNEALPDPPTRKFSWTLHLAKFPIAVMSLPGVAAYHLNISPQLDERGYW